MTYRLHLKLDEHIFTPPRSTYGFYLPRYTVTRCYPSVHPATKPIGVRNGMRSGSRLMLLSPERVAEGSHVSPYEIVTRWLASQPAPQSPPPP